MSAVYTEGENEESGMARCWYMRCECLGSTLKSKGSRSMPIETRALQTMNSLLPNKITRPTKFSVDGGSDDLGVKKLAVVVLIGGVWANGNARRGGWGGQGTTRQCEQDEFVYEMP